MKYKLIIAIALLSCNLSSEVIYKTIPGTPFKDITEPVMVIDKNIIYKNKFMKKQLIQREKK